MACLQAKWLLACEGGDVPPDEPKKPLETPARAATQFRAQSPDPKSLATEAFELLGVNQAQTLSSVTTAELAAAEEQREVEEGDVLAGKYRLTGTLGGGGMGTVFRGEHLTLGIPIAVKVMKPLLASDPEFVTRFQREAHAASLLSHPGVVRVLDFSLSPVPYIVMEYIEGKSLGNLLENSAAPPPLEQVKDIISQVLTALEAAHAAGIVHRDLKPDNIVLSSDASGRSNVKIVDFGLARLDDAKALAPRLTRADYVAGTPTYMSPEQCRSLSVGPSSDLYALGCILTELLQLQPPFVAESSMDMISAQMYLPPPALARPDGAEPVPELLERLRLDLLAKLPHQRPAGAREARQRLLEAMDPELAEARLPQRKRDIPLGARDERAVSGYQSPSQRPGANAGLAAPLTVQLLSLGGSAVGDACVTALGVQGVHVARRATIGALVAAEPLVILDIDADLERARKAMAGVRAALPSATLVVCAAALDTTTMNALIEAGAADIVRSPVDPSTLGRKLRRLSKRLPPM